MSDSTISDAGWIVGGLSVLGGGVRWLHSTITRRSDRRAAELDRREAELAKKYDERMDALEANVGQQGETIKVQGELITEQGDTIKIQGVLIEKQRLAIIVCVDKINADNPSAVELSMVKQLLGDAYPVEPITDVMQALLNKMK